MTATSTISGRTWAYIGAALGGTVSIAANIAHSYVPPKGLAPALAEKWTPEIGAVVGAMFWPLALFVATEILTRVAWPSGRGWQLLRFGGITPVAFVAALVSYRHLSGLLGHYGEEQLVAIVGPLAVDGLMVMSTAALLATADRARTIQTLTTLANPDPVKALAPTQPAVPAPIYVPQPVGDTPVQPTTEPAATPEPVTAARTEVPTPDRVAARITPSPTSIPLRPTTDRPASAGTPKPKPRTTAPTTPVSQLAAPATDKSVTEPEPAQLALPIVVDPALVAKAREIARQYHADNGAPIKAGQLAARLKVNSDLAAQALAVIDLGPNNPTVSTVNGTPVKASR